jgi:P27 family predicted phage terminase small subunit
MRKKSDLEHSLQGTRPNYSVGDYTETLSVCGKPRMPKDLTPEQAELWRSIVKQLWKRRTITKVDALVLEIMCRSWSVWKAAVLAAAIHPTETSVWSGKDGVEHSKTVESAASQMANRYANSLRRLLAELSATPASRERAKPTAEPVRKPKGPHPNSLEAIETEIAQYKAAHPEAETESEIDLNSIKEDEVKP